MLKKIILTLLFVFLIVNYVAAQNNAMMVQLIEYNENTLQSQIYVQNTAGYDLHDLDLYINNIRTGRIANLLADGKAILYFQTITPGTYNVTIKTKEGIEFTREIEFKEFKDTEEELTEAETRPKTASELAKDKEYQEYLEEKKKEEEVRKQRQEAELRRQAELEKAREEDKKVEAEEIAVEEKEGIKEKLPEKIVEEKITEKPDYSLIIVITLILVIMLSIYFFVIKFAFFRKKKKKYAKKKKK